MGSGREMSYLLGQPLSTATSRNGVKMGSKKGSRQRNESFVRLTPLNGDLTRPSLKRKFLATHRSVKLEWIARELRMGVRSGVTRAEQMLKVLLEN
jgi:hypothetical protein